MRTFASSSGGDPVIVFLGVVFLIGYFGYKAYVFFYRPDQWAAERERKHALALAAAEERKARAGRVAGGIVGGIVKAVIGAAIKGRPHH